MHKGTDRNGIRYAIEHEGHLYVAYSNGGGGVGRPSKKGRESWNNNSAELAVIPLRALKVE